MAAALIQVPLHLAFTDAKIHLRKSELWPRPCPVPAPASSPEGTNTRRKWSACCRISAITELASRDGLLSDRLRMIEQLIQHCAEQEEETAQLSWR